VRKTYLLTLVISTLLIGIELLVINSVFLAKPLYKIYADLFNNGQLYEGETHTLFYMRFIFSFITPLSFALAFILSWYIKTSYWRVAQLSLLLLIIATLSVIYFAPYSNQQFSLDNYPNSIGSSVVSSGMLFERNQPSAAISYLVVPYECCKAWTDNGSGRTVIFKTTRQKQRILMSGDIITQAFYIAVTSWDLQNNES
jgi:hypothetical protein